MKKHLIALFILLCSFSAQAAWVLSTDASTLNFISIKKTSVGEIHQFKTLNGSLSAAGELKIDIVPGSVETGIEVRNQRLQDLLFEVDQYPLVTITASIDTKKIYALSAGQSLMKNFKFQLQLHGQSQTLNSFARVIKLANGHIFVVSTRPIILNANQFGLVAGIQRLAEVAKLATISAAIPVTFALEFEPVK